MAELYNMEIFVNPAVHDHIDAYVRLRGSNVPMHTTAIARPIEVTIILFRGVYTRQEFETYIAAVGRKRFECESNDVLCLLAVFPRDQLLEIGLDFEGSYSLSLYQYTTYKTLFAVLDDGDADRAFALFRRMRLREGHGLFLCSSPRQQGSAPVQDEHSSDVRDASDAILESVEEQSVVVAGNSLQLSPIIRDHHMPEFFGDAHMRQFLFSDAIDLQRRPFVPAFQIPAWCVSVQWRDGRRKGAMVCSFLQRAL